MRPHSLTLRLTAWFALACHVLVASGLPLPLGAVARHDTAAARSADKDRSRPFPCMDKPCGCATAEQCFANCCCHTPAQRLAWARAHAVEPAVLAALERRVAAQAATPASCCAAQPQASCCSDAPTPELDAPDVCRDYQSLAADPAPAANETTDDATPRTVILRDALACGGVTFGWLTGGVATPPPPRVVAAVAADRPVAVLVLRDDVAISCRAAPPAPPPRAA